MHATAEIVKSSALPLSHSLSVLVDGSRWREHSGIEVAGIWRTPQQDTNHFRWALPCRRPRSVDSLAAQRLVVLQLPRLHTVTDAATLLANLVLLFCVTVV